MARFDVYDGAGTYLLDCQADLLNYLATRFVVPLLPAAAVPRAARLNPSFKVGEETLVMATQLASAVPAHALGRPVASLADEHAIILGAFDMLLSGY